MVLTQKYNYKIVGKSGKGDNDNDNGIMVASEPYPLCSAVSHACIFV